MLTGIKVTINVNFYSTYYFVLSIATSYKQKVTINVNIMVTFLHTLLVLVIVTNSTFPYVDIWYIYRNFSSPVNALLCTTIIHLNLQVQQNKQHNLYKSNQTLKDA